MTQRKYFGTDGIRGHVGLSNVNPEFALKLGWAVGRILANGHRKKVIIGKDTRVSGYMLESALEAGLSAAGVDVHLLGPMPTPGIAYLTQTLHASAGIVISASHNLFEDNGIKFFSADGSKLPDEQEIAIETEMEKPLQMVASRQLGKAKRINDAVGRYIEFCKSTVPFMMRLSGMKIVVDCANGATYHIAPNVFSELDAEVISIGDKPNGFNINDNCGSTSPELLQKKVLEEKADIGIALDGDGDRLLMVDNQGNCINGDQLLYIIAKDRLERGLLSGGVVGTSMSNFGLEHALTQLEIPFARAQVGDRYVLEALKERGWKIGGESSGHIVCLDKTTTGDGIVAALQVVACMVRNNCGLAELLTGISLCPQVIVNVPTVHAAKICEHPDMQRCLADVTTLMQGKGRVLLRPSGTEPLLRLMLEGEDSALITKNVNYLKGIIEEVGSGFSPVI
ncbi:MAG: phosphoglucosamine mutase [Legionellaceae bacterium]|nr:phosphoglucosamine mutase [Legionellaceae bacterium]